jgi:hypothetical protein
MRQGVVNMLDLKLDLKYDLYIESNNESYVNQKISSSDNILLLNTKNDTGKTTVLSLIKLALSGFDLENIKENIDKSKLEFLLNKTKFKLNLKIHDFNNSFSICVNHELDKSVEYKLNGQPSGPSGILDQIDVIYEIPGEPIKKLYHILEQISYVISDYKNKIDNYLSRIEKQYEKLKEYHDSKKLKEVLNKKLNDFNEKYENAIKERDSNYQKYHDIHDAYVYNRYKLLESRIARLGDYKQNLENLKKNKNKDNTKSSKLEKKFSDSASELRNKIYDNKNIFENVDEFKDKTNELFNKKLTYLIQPQAINDEIIKYYYNYFRDVCNYTEEKLKTIPEEVLNKKPFIDKLIDLLEEYQNKNMEMPIYGTPLDEVLDQLRTIQHKENLENSEVNKLKTLESSCKTILEYITKDFIISYQALIDSNNGDPRKNIDIDDIDGKLFKTNSEIDKYTKELNSLTDDFNKLAKDYPYKDTDVLNKLMNDLKKDIDNNNKQIEIFKSDINNLQNQVQSISTEVPSGQLSLEELEFKQKALNSVKTKLLSYNQLISSIIEDKIPKNDDTFSKNLGNYLAGTVKTIYHIGKTYNLTSIDFIHKTYITNEGTMDFQQIGRGTTGVNGLISRIKTKDKKKLVLLIDEIADMDNDNLNKLKEAINEEIKSGHILLCVMAKPSI